MNGRIIQLSEIEKTDVDRWQQLSEDAVELNPLFEPASLMPAVKFLPNGLEIKLIVAEENGVFYGCMPMERSRFTRDRLFPTTLELAFRSFTTQVRRNRYDLTPLLLEERIEHTWRVLLDVDDAVVANRRVSFLRLESMNFDGPVEVSLRNVIDELQLKTLKLAEWTRPVKLRSDVPGGGFSTGKKSKSENRIRTYQRRLSEELGAEVRTVDRSDDPTMVEVLARIERSGYKFASGVAVESFPGEAEWLSATCENFRRQGRLLVYTLQADETVIAIAMYFRAKGRLLTIHKAYDEQFQKYNPGVQLDLGLFSALDSLHEILMIDSCTRADAEQSYRRFNDTRRVGTLIVATGGKRYGAILVIFSAARRPFMKMLLALNEKALVKRIAHRIAVRVMPKIKKGRS